jgi:hypothetical protein
VIGGNSRVQLVIKTLTPTLSHREREIKKFLSHREEQTGWLYFTNGSA